jgi:hypothetical protein
VPVFDLPDDELAAIWRAIEDDRFPHAPRLDPLRAALARLEAATEQKNAPEGGGLSEPSKPTPHSKASAAS